MERRDFLMKSGILSAFGIVGQTTFAALPIADEDKLSPVLLPPLAPLAHDNGMTVRVWIRSAMTNGVYSNIECACAPKLMRLAFASKND